MLKNVYINLNLCNFFEALSMKGYCTLPFENNFFSLFHSKRILKKKFCVSVYVRLGYKFRNYYICIETFFK